MDLDFIARNTELSDQQRALAQKKFNRLAKYFNAVQEARLTVAQEKHRVCIEAYIRGKDFEVEASSETPEWTSSLQDLVGKLEQQARRMKQKLTGRKRPREKEAGFDSVRLGLNVSGVEAMELLDHFGQTTVLHFTNVVRNPQIDPGTFRFTPPKGADVLGD